MTTPRIFAPMNQLAGKKLRRSDIADFTCLSWAIVVGNYPQTARKITSFKWIGVYKVLMTYQCQKATT